VSKHRHIDGILKKWPYQPGVVLSRRVSGSDGREVLQMRIEMGVLQLETAGRPDGTHPEGFETYYDYLLAESLHQPSDFLLSDEQCEEVDREFVQFYHRRVCWLALREFHAAKEDAQHTLNLMDFASAHSDDEQWILSHEQYRPFVMFHHVQASALAEFEDGGPAAAVEQIDSGLQDFEKLFSEYDAIEAFEEDELVSRLRELRASICDQFDVNSSINEISLSDQLADAVDREDYERAAQLRDEIARRGGP